MEGGTKSCKGVVCVSNISFVYQASPVVNIFMLRVNETQIVYPWMSGAQDN